MDESLNKLRERLSALSYNDVRKEAKQYSISARGKKTELIDKILDVEAMRLNEGGHTAVSDIADKDSKMDEGLELELDPSPDGQGTLNDTYTVDEQDEFLSDDNDDENCEPQNASGGAQCQHSAFSDDLSKTQLPDLEMDSLPYVTCQTSEELANPRENSADSNKSSTNEQHSTDSTSSALIVKASNFSFLPVLKTSSTKPGGTAGGSGLASRLTSIPTAVGGSRFERHHKKLFEGMTSISEIDRRRKERLEKQNAGVSDRLKILASPKKVARREPANFSFGEVPVADYAKIQRPYNENAANVTPTAATTQRRSLRQLNTNSGEKKLNVKQLTMSASKATGSSGRSRNIRQATTPVLTPRLERLATPKGAQTSFHDEKVNKFGGPNYTPHKGRFEYVDTTKMTDQELIAYKLAKSKK